MKTIQKYLAVLMMVLLCVGILTMPAYAATKSQDGMEVTLATDKDTYSQGENIVATLTVKNTNDVAVLNVSMESLIPDGYVLSKDDENIMEIDRLDPGETTVLKVTFVAEPDQSGTSTPDKPKEDETTPNRPNPESSAPNTSDNYAMGFWCVLLIVAVVSVTVLTVKYKLWKQMLAVLLCGAMLLPMFGQISVQAEDTKTDKKTIDVSTTVKVGDRQVDVKAMVSYQLVTDEDPEDPEGVFYTVTFETNGGSEVKAQTVAKGETATEPDTPVLEGNTFINWYADAELTTVYDFSTPINSNITLYAAWEVDASGPDDAVDEEDTEVSKDDKCILTASETEVLANSNTEVMFYVNSTLTVSYFELYINGESTGVKLYDNGDYDNTGDDIPNDGCYAGYYVIDLDIEDDIVFAAKSTVGTTNVCTNEVSIFVYYELTDDQCDEMDMVSNNLQTIIAETEANNTMLPDVELAELIHDNLMQYLTQLESDGIIRNIHDNADNYTISFVYVSTDISSGVEYFSEAEELELPEDSSTEYFTNLTGDNASAQTENGGAKLGTINIDYITYKEQALLLCHTGFNATVQNGTFPHTTRNLTGVLEKAGFNVDARYNVTVDDFKGMQDYAFIAVECHGSYYGTWVGPFTYEETPVICTDQQATKVNRKTYSADLKKHRLADVLPKGATHNSYWIRPDFFDFYYSDDELKANVVSLGCCLGAYSSELVDSLCSAGANTVYAYSDTVYQAYDCVMSDAIVNRLIAGDNVDEALDAAKLAYGADDLVWGAAQAAGGNTAFDTLKAERAVCNCYGSQSTLIHKSLQNGSFDANSDLLGSRVTGWRKHGDVRSVFRLAGLVPQSPNKMAIISSGFGSMNDETTSCIYQTFLVPENANTLKFSYDIVSEEPMEYVGSEYDDIFQVDILSTDGDVLETLAFESVNTSTWYAVDGINFPGGDDTTYHTRWKTVSNDAISAYRGQLIVLRFAVQDTSDTIYDTAALIDSVSIT